MARAAKEIAHYRNVLEFLGHRQLSPTLLFCDNAQAIMDVDNQHLSTRTRYLLRDFFFLLDFVHRGDVTPVWLSSHHMLADIFTKDLPAATLLPFVQRLLGITTTGNATTSLNDVTTSKQKKKKKTNMGSGVESYDPCRNRMTGTTHGREKGTDVRNTIKGTEIKE